MIARNAIGILTLVVLLAPPFASAHSPSAVDDLLPPGFTQAPSPPSSDEPMAEYSSEAPGSGSGYRINFRCPAILMGGVDPPPQEPVCPAIITDLQDIMGSPVLMVDPNEPGYMGFNAMHGGRGVQSLGNEPPTNQSRDNFLHQPHTTFYSPDGALEYWFDNPYYSPLQLPPNRQNLEDPAGMVPTTQLTGKQVFGEDNAAAVDAQGRVYLASLYSWRNTTGGGSWQYAVALWKSNRVNQPVDYFTGVKIIKLGPNVVADSIHAVYVPYADRVVVLWRETDPTEGAKLKSYVNLTWTKPGKGAIWYPMKDKQKIGTCSGITNPLAYQGEVYVGCFADKGYTIPNATLGQLQIHAIDVRNEAFTNRYVDETTISTTKNGANALLFDRTAGRMGIAAAGIANNGKPFLNIAYGFAGAAWDEAERYGDLITQDKINGGIVRPPSPAYEIIEARVNAAAFVLRSGSIHLVYQERYRPSDAATQPPSTNVAEFYKGLISLSSAGERGINAVVALGARNADADDRQAQNALAGCQVFDHRYQGPSLDVYRDLHDSIVIWANKAGHQREFLLYADCGNVRFAEVFEEDFVPFSFPVPPGTPPIPAPLATANPATTGAVAGVLAGAMVLRMLAFKRKLAVEAPA